MKSNRWPTSRLTTTHKWPRCNNCRLNNRLVYDALRWGGWSDSECPPVPRPRTLTRSMSPLPLLQVTQQQQQHHARHIQHYKGKCVCGMYQRVLLSLVRARNIENVFKNPIHSTVDNDAVGWISSPQGGNTYTNTQNGKQVKMESLRMDVKTKEKTSQVLHTSIRLLFLFSPHFLGSRWQRVNSSYTGDEMCS